MKFERLDENKIRCTLTKAELAEKHINLTELAYGTDKAKALFKDLMDKAKEELGFEVDDMPLMIEAIPVKPDSLMLIITKVSNPDEMNSRFSKFAGLSPNEVADNMLDTEQGAPEAAEQTAAYDAWKEEASDINVKDAAYVVFAFESIRDVISVAHIVTGYYKSDNSLYSNPHDNRLYLLMYRNHNTEDEMKRVGLKASEYGFYIKTIYSSREFFDEHFQLIIKDDALQRLAEI
ncbi:MAG: adaptor protein MecA [Eubacterium sp.]|nr:adaptor protein MecA [Eubacterium sp.]